MRRWKCIKVNGTKGFTVGNIYTTDNYGNNLRYDDGTKSSEGIKNGIAWSAKFEEVTTFTKDDLKPCMVVKRRNGSVCGIFQIKNGLKFQEELGGGNCDDKDYNDDFTSKINSDCDIMEVFGFSNMCFNISTENRELLWKRTEKSANDLKIEELQQKAKEIQDELEKLKGDK